MDTADLSEFACPPGIHRRTGQLTAATRSPRSAGSRASGFPRPSAGGRRRARCAAPYPVVMARLMTTDRGLGRLDAGGETLTLLQPGQPDLGAALESGMSVEQIV